MSQTFEVVTSNGLMHFWMSEFSGILTCVCINILILHCVLFAVLPAFFVKMYHYSIYTYRHIYTLN